MADVYALLHTDVVDSTALATKIGDDAMTVLWRTHLRGSRDLLRRWNGHEIDNSDGLMLRFDSAADAIAFAADDHRLLANGLPHPMKARAGLHVGPLELRANAPEDVARGARAVEVLGLTKVIAARLMALALGGQTLVSAEAQTALAGTPWQVMPHGHWRMKGLDEPMAVFEAGGSSAPFEPPPDGPKAQRVVRVRDRWAPLAEVWHSLPAERDQFVGRSADLQALLLRLRAGARLVTLHGVGGIGKTRLALRFGWTWLGDHAGGVAFCDLSAATTADGVMHSTAQGLSLPLGRDPLAQIGRAIAGRGKCLLIIDNAEQVIEPVREAVGHWLDAAPAAQIIVTSRVTLGIPGEVVLALDSLTAPEAITLFQDRAASASKDYASLAADSAVLATLVNRLDGLPLAIELAAARVPTMAPAQILARLDQRFRLLTSSGSRPGRQATLKATLDWSWDLLSPLERDALLQLAVFEGGFTLAAAEAVLDLSAHPGDVWVPDVVQSLVDRSLLRPAGVARLVLLRSVQDYLQQRTDDAAAHAVERRHWAYVAGLDDTNPDAAPQAELDNKIAACRRAAAAGDVAAAVRCLALAWAGLRLTGPLRLADSLADAVRRLPGLDPGQQLLVEWLSASACFASGAVADAARACERGLALLDAQPVATVAALRILTMAGEVAAAQGLAGRANHCFERAAALADADGVDAASRCHLLNAQGVWATDSSRLELAQTRYQQALAVAEQSGDRRWQGGVLGNLGMLSHSQGRLDEAAAFYERALALSAASGDKHWEGNMRCNLGLAYHGMGRSVEARVQLLAACDIAGAVGNPGLGAAAECNLGVVSMAVGDDADARPLLHFRQAVAIAVSADDLRTAAQAAAYLACALCRAADLTGARQALGESRCHNSALADGLALGVAWCADAEIESAAQRPAEALVLLGQARAVLLREGWGESSELGAWLADTESRLLQLPRLATKGS